MNRFLMTICLKKRHYMQFNIFCMFVFYLKRQTLWKAVNETIYMSINVAVTPFRCTRSASNRCLYLWHIFISDLIAACQDMVSLNWFNVQHTHCWQPFDWAETKCSISSKWSKPFNINTAALETGGTFYFPPQWPSSKTDDKLFELLHAPAKYSGGRTA